MLCLPPTHHDFGQPQQSQQQLLDAWDGPSAFFVGELDGSPASASGPSAPASEAAAAAAVPSSSGGSGLLMDVEGSGLSLGALGDELLLGEGSGALPWDSGFPAIPEDDELHDTQHQLGLPLQPLPEAPAHAAELLHGGSAGAGKALGVPVILPRLQLHTAMYVPMEGAQAAAGLGLLPSSPMSALDLAGGGLGAASPTSSSVSSLLDGGAAGGALASSSMPRICSMPNLHLTLAAGAAAHPLPSAAAHAHSEQQYQYLGEAAGPAGGMRRQAAAGAAGIPKSKSTSDMLDLTRYNVPHLEYLTPPHLRKGKGGRQPAADPRLDPRVDPKKARRILANRLSAAKSKMKQKSSSESQRSRTEMLRLQRDAAAAEAEGYHAACAQELEEQQALVRQLQALEEHVAIQRALQARLGAMRKEAAAPALPSPTNFWAV